MDHSFRSTRDIIIRTRRFEEAKHFYENVMKLPVVHSSADLMGYDTGAFRLYVESGEKEHGAVFEFLVPDLDAARESLLDAGGKIVEQVASHCYVRDPFGLTFNINQRS